MNVLPPQGVVDWLLAPNRILVVLGVLIGAAVIVFATLTMSRSRGQAAVVSTARRRLALSSGSSSWQLWLLAATGLVLSLASGYTTWKGMTNFTGEALLSLMVTFGIQGVMLIVAWLIGESFASGMNRRLPDGRPVGRYDAIIGMILAFTVVAVAFYWLLYSFGAVDWAGRSSVNWGRFADVSVYFALTLIVLAVLAFNFSRGGELSVPYIQSSRVIVKNAVLWVMFAACMATSVFFSYDALFTVIFPKEERARAAQLRAQNQVAGIVADIGSTIERRRIEEIDELFRHPGWKAYDANLTDLYRKSQSAEKDIERYFESQMEARKRSIDEQQNRIASAKSGSAGLRTRKTSMTGELARLKADRPGLASDLMVKKSELDARARSVDAKRVEAQAESKGAEGTGKIGRGPMYRQRMEEMRQLEAAYQIQQRRVADAQERFSEVNGKIARNEAELAQIDGDLAKYSAEASTAESRIKLTEGQTAVQDLPRVDPARVRQAFDKARTEYRQGPTRERLGALQQQCSDLYRALAATPATKSLVSGVDCDPKQAAEASAVMFALNSGIRTFGAKCAGGDKLDQQKTTDSLWSFARTCLADSGLPSRETDQMRGKINTAELSRDDRAHPFVATLNAFQDGNKLAYLSLGIAVAMDMLVFMSGLFGANAVRSPLSDVPSSRARSGRQLEAIIENALLPDTFDTARAVLHSMHPITPHDGFTARVIIPADDPHAADIRRVLNAASTIGAVRHREGNEPIYEVRAELFEFLSMIAKRAFEADDENARMAELRKMTTVALQPHVGDHADIVLHHCRPITENRGFSAEVLLGHAGPDDAFIVQRALNAGSILNYVQRDERLDQEPLQRYYVHKQLYKTLLLISSAYPRTGHRSFAPRLEAPQHAQAPALGGDITPRPLALPDSHSAAQQVAQQIPASNFVDELAQELAKDHKSNPNAGLQMATPSVGPGFAEPAQQAFSQNITSKQLEDAFIAVFVEALGVDPDAYLEMAGELYGAALATTDTFMHVRRSNPVLDDELAKPEREAHVRINRMHDRLIDSPNAQSPQGADALRVAHDNVLDNLAVIGLLPNGPVEAKLKSLQAELDARNDDLKLYPDEEELLRLVRRLLSRLASSPRNSAESWKTIGAQLDQDNSAASGQLAAFMQPGKHSIN